MNVLNIAAAVCFSFLAIISTASASDYYHDQGINDSYEYQGDSGMSDQMNSYSDDPRFMDNRYQMSEAVREMGFENGDQAAIVDHVTQDGGYMNADSLRESGISDEAWNQMRDDARFD